LKQCTAEDKDAKQLTQQLSTYGQLYCIHIYLIGDKWHVTTPIYHQCNKKIIIYKNITWYYWSIPKTYGHAGKRFI